MGMMFSEFVFDNHAPALDDVCSRITDICGLPVVVRRNDPDDIHLLDASIAFESQPETELEICVYDREIVRQSIDDSFDHPAQSAFMKNIVAGANSPDGTQSVHLQGYLGQERTLFVVTELALDSLGGLPQHEIPADDRNVYGKNISDNELAERHLTNQKELRKSGILTAMLLPVILPIWAFGVLWSTVCLPFRIWQASRFVQRLEDKTCARDS